MNNFFSIKNDLASKSEIDGEYILQGERLALFQHCLLDIYSDILRVCEKHGIKPSLIGGSLLGKVRHNGFIPWDDDFDIAMSREDYDLFKSLSDELLPKYILAAPGYRGAMPCNFIKVYMNDSDYETAEMTDNVLKKVSIDIFPIDYAPNNRLLRKMKAIFCNYYIGIISSMRFKKMNQNTKTGSVGFRMWINKHIRLLIGSVFSFSDDYKRISKLDNYIKGRRKTNWCTIAVGRKHYDGECLQENVFFPFQESDYCGRKIWVLNQPEQYLKNLYGNYMSIPPENKREHHPIRKCSIAGHKIV